MADFRFCLCIACTICLKSTRSDITYLKHFVPVCIDLMICNDTLRGVPLLLLANKQDLEVSCFVSLLVCSRSSEITAAETEKICWTCAVKFDLFVMP